MPNPVPGSGPLPCTHRAAGRACTQNEIEGLGFCFRHVPDEMLDEAEEITGYRRCRRDFGEPGACRMVAVAATEPPRCQGHGAETGSHTSQHASRRVIEGRVADRMTAIMAEHGERLLSPGAAPDPLTGLLQLADEMNEWKNIMREIVAYLLSKDRIRAAHNRVGEQLRAEVLIYERAMERLAQLWERIIRLGIEARLAKLDDNQARLVEGALATALAGTGLGLVEQEKARQVLRRELVRAAK